MCIKLKSEPSTLTIVKSLMKEVAGVGVPTYRLMNMSTVLKIKEEIFHLRLVRQEMCPLHNQRCAVGVLHLFFELKILSNDVHLLRL